jgi:hypothetical protein
MGQTAREWLGLERWTETDMRWAALDVARAACTLHNGGFAGNMIPWSLWREAASRRWEQKGKPVEAAQVGRMTWPACTTRDTGHVSRVGTAADNNEGVVPNYWFSDEQQQETGRREGEGEKEDEREERGGGGGGEGGEGGGNENRRGGEGREESGAREEREGGRPRPHKRSFQCSPCSQLRARTRARDGN